MASRGTAPKLRRSMATLSQLLAQHRCILVVDAASTRVQVGLLRAGEPARWASSADESGKAVFALTADLLRAANLDLNAVAAFAYDVGPGSMLGVRTVAMALRTWLVLSPRPVFGYFSLQALAQQLAGAGAAPPFAVIADARRDTWHFATVPSPTGPSAPRRATAAEVAAFAGDVYLPTAFRAFSAAPRATSDCPFDLETIFAALPDADLFAPIDAPDAFQHEAPEYKKWTAEVHSAERAGR